MCFLTDFEGIGCVTGVSNSTISATTPPVTKVNIRFKTSLS